MFAKHSVSAPWPPARPASPTTPSPPSSASDSSPSRAGSTPQRPVRHASRQVPEEVRRWLEEEYPALVARAKAEGAEIHWGDETGARAEAARQRGYAPPSEPPEQAVSGRRFRVNMVSTI